MQAMPGLPSCLCEFVHQLFESVFELDVRGEVEQFARSVGATIKTGHIESARGSIEDMAPSTPQTDRKIRQLLQRRRLAGQQVDRRQRTFSGPQASDDPQQAARGVQKVCEVERVVASIDPQRESGRSGSCKTGNHPISMVSNAPIDIAQPDNGDLHSLCAGGHTEFFCGHL